MPSFTVHSLFPLLLLLAVPYFDRRKVWALWPIVHVPDLDYFFGFHRATLGNVFVLLPFAIGLAYAHWGPQKRPALGEWMTIAMIYLGSHIAMDVFVGGSVLLYPFSLYTVCFDAEILIETATNTPFFTFAPCSHEGIPVVSAYYPWLSFYDAAILALVLPFSMAIGARMAWRAWRARSSP